jgi:ribosomal protein S9
MKSKSTGQIEFAPHYTFKRKKSQATLCVVRGESGLRINGTSTGPYFRPAVLDLLCKYPVGEYRFDISCAGGGVSSQAEVILKVIAKAMVCLNIYDKREIISYDRSILSSDGRQTYPKLAEGKARAKRQKSYR